VILLSDPLMYFLTRLRDHQVQITLPRHLAEFDLVRRENLCNGSHSFYIRLSILFAMRCTAGSSFLLEELGLELVLQLCNL